MLVEGNSLLAIMSYVPLPSYYPFISRDWNILVTFKHFTFHRNSRFNKRTQKLAFKYHQGTKIASSICNLSMYILAFIGD